MQIPVSYRERVIDLAPLGCNEVAWLNADAIEFLKSLHSEIQIVLGGDVVQHLEGRWGHNGDSWHYESDTSRQPSWNSASSISKAIQYIENYPKGPYAFVLVLA